ncbi:B12-binding domain-containing radical SAM protein [Vibrio mediterranei]|uniref:B12-binding domain-containing radical SAM protein n=1 Tax=Vibrio mediterranei TaxID=689 RepID=UPI0022835AF5|nr:radical SAM protein [Vibrio mediterranei]MCY9853389.1 radical SAM protein [Vibrio mediterranei]
MKIYLIKASAGSDYSKYKATTGGPPQNIFAAAAATPKWYSLDMVDETIGHQANLNTDADVVVIFMSTPDAYRAYELASAYKQLGKTVILGGLHTHFNPKEAALHADSIIIGEVENYWVQLLGDAERGVLKPKYESSQPVDLSVLKPYPTDIISPSTYDYVWSVLVTRGCPFKCNFCLVPRFFNKFQQRPIAHIVSELEHLKSLGVEWVELHSDNLTHDREYAIALFKAIEPLNMSFYGETTVLIARDKELLQAAAKAGFKAVLLGIETPSGDALKAQQKGFVKPSKMKAHIAEIKRHDIEVWGDFLFGFDEHDTSIFDQTQAFIKEIKVDKVIPHYMIPFPGSETFSQLEREGRILTTDWSKYDGSHPVYQPKNMTVRELENGIHWIWRKNTSLKERLFTWFR